MTLEQLKLAADELTPDERDELAEYLISSHDGAQQSEIDGEILEAWPPELERRRAELENGTSKSQPGDEAMREIFGNRP